MPFFVEGEDGRVIYIRLLAGKDAKSLAAIRRQDLDIVRREASNLLIA